MLRRRPDRPGLKAASWFVNVDFVLVTGPLVCVSSWQPTANVLRARGAQVEVPDVLAATAEPPAWREWTDHLLNLVPINGQQIFVGNSSASALVAEMAAKRPCKGILIVDGEIPPSTGRAPPVRDSFRQFIGGLADANGRLPLWSRWFSGDARREALVGIEALRKRPDVFERFEAALPRMSVGWFDDEIDLRGWDHVPAGFVLTSAIYGHAAEEAMRRGWPIRQLSGTHLHPALEPQETADAIIAVAQEIARS